MSGEAYRLRDPDPGLGSRVSTTQSQLAVLPSLPPHSPRPHARSQALGRACADPAATAGGPAESGADAGVARPSPGRPRPGLTGVDQPAHAHLGPRRRLRPHFRETDGCARLWRPAGRTRRRDGRGRGRGAGSDWPPGSPRPAPPAPAIRRPFCVARSTFGVIHSSFVRSPCRRLAEVYRAPGLGRVLAQALPGLRRSCPCLSRPLCQVPHHSCSSPPLSLGLHQGPSFWRFSLLLAFQAARPCSISLLQLSPTQHFPCALPSLLVFQSGSSVGLRPLCHLGSCLSVPPAPDPLLKGVFLASSAPASSLSHVATVASSQDFTTSSISLTPPLFQISTPTFFHVISNQD